MRFFLRELYWGNQGQSKGGRRKPDRARPSTAACDGQTSAAQDSAFLFSAGPPHLPPGAGPTPVPTWSRSVQVGKHQCSFLPGALNRRPLYPTPLPTSIPGGAWGALPSWCRAAGGPSGFLTPISSGTRPVHSHSAGTAWPQGWGISLTRVLGSRPLGSRPSTPLHLSSAVLEVAPRPLLPRSPAAGVPLSRPLCRTCWHSSHRTPAPPAHWSLTHIPGRCGGFSPPSPALRLMVTWQGPRGDVSPRPSTLGASFHPECSYPSSNWAPPGTRPLRI